MNNYIFLVWDPVFLLTTTYLDFVFQTANITGGRIYFCMIGIMTSANAYGFMEMLYAVGVGVVPRIIICLVVAATCIFLNITNIMYPSTNIKDLPKAFDKLDVPNFIQMDPKEINKNKEKWIDEWLNAS